MEQPLRIELRRVVDVCRRELEADLRTQVGPASSAVEVRDAACLALLRLACWKLTHSPGRSPDTVHADDASFHWDTSTLDAPDWPPELATLEWSGGQMPRAVPSSAAFKRVLSLLGQPAITSVWEDDETLGWIYQYSAPRRLRGQARRASRAPRHVDDLVLRNRFYTPRYVVRFLVDNTLGRLWCEMRQGSSELFDRCHLMVRRPGEGTVRRQPRDPRDLKIMDPACGSGHFLLYCFDLLETIYREAWAAGDGPPSASTGRGLHQDYASHDALEQALPTLILTNNLHGLDVDRRAIQIATLALRLRVLRSAARLGLRAQSQSTAPNRLAWAEPLPDRDPTGEIGTLLKPGNDDGRADGPAPSEACWTSLLCDRYAVVLMNPPFGEPSPHTKAYLRQHYPRSRQDLFAAFVEQGLELLEPGGMLGAITPRTGFFLSTFRRWREQILLAEARPTVVADLGYGVLDGAMVEAAAYCLERRTPIPVPFPRHGGRGSLPSRRLGATVSPPRTGNHKGPGVG